MIFYDSRLVRRLFDTTMQERIRIYPSTKEQMESSIASAKDPELKKAYSEMLEKNTYTKIKYLI